MSSEPGIPDSPAPAGAPDNPAALGAAEATRRMAAGTLTSEALVAACLDRIAERDSDVRAWVHLDADAALAEARARDAEPPRGPLHGIPVGIKDIYDTADMPTAYGSVLYEGHRPAVDSAPVEALRAAGAIIPGKTVTTEFAYLTPGPTRNPYDLSRSPGGSSSGSAAGVGDYHVPLAMGSQTGGSTIRPAAYCGVYGFKPTFGFVNIDGVRPLAMALDTAGWFARNVEDLALLGSVLHPLIDAELRPLATPPRIGIVRTADWERATADVQGAIDGLADVLANAGCAVAEVDWPEECNDLGTAWEAVIAAGAASALAPEYEQHRDRMGDHIRTLIEQGRALTPSERSAAEATALRCRALVSELFEDYDAFLTPATGDVAPERLDSTGDPLFNRSWTLLRLPCLAVPSGLDASGLPLAAQLVGRHGGDQALLELAAWVEGVVGE
ncbi:MAG: amidase [Chloroflexota bacterium]|nr:amidase [Chloroflexota bacterium]